MVPVVFSFYPKHFIIIINYFVDFYDIHEFWRIVKPQKFMPTSKACTVEIKNKLNKNK